MLVLAAGIKLHSQLTHIKETLLVALCHDFRTKVTDSTRRKSRNSLPLPQTGVERNQNSRTPYDRRSAGAAPRSQIPVPVPITAVAATSAVVASTSSGSASSSLSTRQRKRTRPYDTTSATTPTASTSSSTAPPASRTRSSQPSPPKKARLSASQVASQSTSQQQQQQSNSRTNIGAGTCQLKSSSYLLPIAIYGLRCGGKITFRSHKSLYTKKKGEKSICFINATHGCWARPNKEEKPSCSPGGGSLLCRNAQTCMCLRVRLFFFLFFLSYHCKRHNSKLGESAHFSPFLLEKRHFI